MLPISSRRRSSTKMVSQPISSDCGKFWWVCTRLERPTSMTTPARCTKQRLLYRMVLSTAVDCLYCTFPYSHVLCSALSVRLLQYVPHSITVGICICTHVVNSHVMFYTCMYCHCCISVLAALYGCCAVYSCAVCFVLFAAVLYVLSVQVGVVCLSGSRLEYSPLSTDFDLPTTSISPRIACFLCEMNKEVTVWKRVGISKKASPRKNPEGKTRN